MVNTNCSMLTDLTTFPDEFTLDNGKKINPWKNFTVGKVILCSLTLCDFISIPGGPRFFFATIAHALHNLINVQIYGETTGLTRLNHDKESIVILHYALFFSSIVSSGATIAHIKINSMEEGEVSEEFEKLIQIASLIFLVAFSILTISMANRDRFYPLKFNDRLIN